MDVVPAYVYNSSTLEAEAEELNLKPAWAT